MTVSYLFFTWRLGVKPMLRRVFKPGDQDASAAARGMSALLFRIAPSDPATFAAAVGLALLMAFAGSLLPAIRAVRVVTPISVVRAE